MVDEVNYRCVNTACGRAFARQVPFCPFCGTPQSAAAQPAQPQPQPQPAPAVTPAAPRSWPIPPATTAPVEAPKPAPQPAKPAPVPVEAPKPVPKAVPQPAPTPAVTPAVVKPKPATDTGKPAKPAKPPSKPVRLRTWIMAIAAIGLVWLFVKPGSVSEQLNGRVDAAVALSLECKTEQARAELATLKNDQASAAQLKRLQTALSDNAPACEKKRLRGKAWTEAQTAIDAALQANALDRAASRLATFVRRWGDDPDSLELGGKIDVRKAEKLLDEADACLARSDRGCLENRIIGAERYKRPELAGRIKTLRDGLSNLLTSTVLGQQTAPAVQAPAALANEPPRQAAPVSAPVPSPAPAPSRVISTAPAAPEVNQKARQILDAAERELAQGNYKGAMDKADICATMIDTGNRECLALKQKAERLNRDMLRCVAGGSDWVNNRCN